MLIIATLGPEGSNHELVSVRYAKAIGLVNFRLRLVEEFSRAVMLLKEREADCIVQCAAHPDVARTIGENRQELFVIDTFVAPAKPLAILTRTDVADPQVIAFHPSTRSYADLANWTTCIEEQSTVRVSEGLVSGKYHSGIAPLELAAAYPEILRVDLKIYAPHDAWLVYASQATCVDGIIAWRESPGASLLHAISEGVQSQQIGPGDDQHGT